MNERLSRELELVAQKYGELEVGPNLDWFIVKQLPLDPGWNKVTTAILVLVPGAYPTTPPDNFYADADLRLASGNAPGNTSAGQQAAGRSWILFSYHVESGDWHSDPSPEQGHNFLTFLDGVVRRLKETS